MRVLVIHNFYKQAGGEDQVYRDEVALLTEKGTTVEVLEYDNDEIDKMGRASLARNTIWSRESYDRIRAACANLKPQVVHFHNTFPLVSASGYAAAHDEGAAVVQTLHNYRLICPASILYRDGHVCEDCVGRVIPWPSVVHACYRDNRAASAMTAAMLTINRAKHVYKTSVDRYIALTRFARDKLVAGGLPAEKMIVKPNFARDTGVGTGSGNFVLFVGRLAPEKGIATMLTAWGQRDRSSSPELKLRIIGDGPLKSFVEEHAAKDSSIEYLGRIPGGEVAGHLGDAKLLLFPSEWYEGLPRTIVESYVKGTPVLASRLGSMMELIEEGRTGSLFRPNDPADLIKQLDRVLSDCPELEKLRAGARAVFASKYGADENYSLLIKAYEVALAAASHTAR